MAETDEEDREMPDPSDMDDPDGPPVVACAYCGKMIHEQSEWCHHCGKYVTEEDAQPVPKWIMIGTLLGLLGLCGGVLVWMFS